MAGHGMGTAEAVVSVKGVLERLRSNQLIRRSLDRTELPVDVRVRIDSLLEAPHLPIQTSQQVRAAYDDIGALVAFCRALQGDVLGGLRREAAGTNRGGDERNRILLSLTLQVLPAGLRELSDRLTDLWVSTHRRDLEIHGESHALAPRYVGVAAGLRALTEANT